MAKIDILGAVDQAEKIVPKLGNMILSIALFIILIGSVVYIGVSGGIELPVAFVTFLNGDFVSNVVTLFTKPITVAVTIVSFLVLVAIFALFKGYAGKGGSGSKM